MIWSAVDKYWLGVKFGESIEARKKLRLYSKPLWLDCHYLQERLSHILKKIESDSDVKSLMLSPKFAPSLEWFTKEGHYITSTAYMIASVACWIRLFQRDVVFLNFSKSSLSAEFFAVTENYKRTLSKKPSILWYYYINGIGDYLIQEQKGIPISVADFSVKLCSDDKFREYYDQLFQFMNEVASGKNNEGLKNTIESLQNIKAFLNKNGAVPEMITFHN